MSRIHGFSVINHPGSGVPAEPTASINLADTDRGFLPNRLTTAQRDAISDPAPGLLIYNTSDAVYQFFDGATWTAVGGGSNSGLVLSKKLLLRVTTHSLDDGETWPAGGLLSLFSSPLTVIEAPGAGKFLYLVENPVYAYTFVTAAYDPNGSTGLVYGDPADAVPADSGEGGQLTATVSRIYISQGVFGGYDTTVLINKPLVMATFNTDSDLANGDGTMQVDIRYRIVDLS